MFGYQVSSTGVMWVILSLLCYVSCLDIRISQQGPSAQFQQVKSGVLEIQEGRKEYYRYSIVYYISRDPPVPAVHDRESVQL